MAVEPLTPERRRQQTRDTLLQAAAQVFAERGFHGASLDDVARVAGFTKGAVYSNFKGKDDLFLAVLEARYQRILSSLQATLYDGTDDLKEHSSDWVDYVRAEIREEEELWGVLMQEFRVYALRNPEAMSKLAAVQRADVEATAQLITTERERYGIDLPEPPLHQARIVIALFRGLGDMRSVEHDAVDDSLLESAISFVERAMFPPAVEP
jgi:AcrR family transcriptional regulator